MKIPLKDSFEDELRRKGYSEEAIMMMVFSQYLNKAETESNDD
jgi:hypothetical protein